ncbi:MULTISPECIES: ABC transporter permease [Shimia]|uniref:ABC transporter permease n=1 Tax=Shimia TaxID=573139 RepID=UPI001FB1CA7A|nr:MULTISPECIES: ABC transporter permease [Shimia]MDV4146282.1 ABC transporter permease [Shimia sp. FJ5]
MDIVTAIVGRLLKAVITLLMIVILNFFLIHAAPGDPAAVMAGEAGAADAKYIAQLREQFGLDQPLMVQFWNYVSGVLQLDLGYSYRQQMPVLDLILERLPATLILTLTAFGMSLLLGIVFGLAAAARQGKWSDTVITSLSLLFYATPLFWVALMAVVLFSVKLGWFPAFGYETVGADYVGFQMVLDRLKHLVLPAFTLGLFFMAVYLRMTRSSVLEVSQMDFVKTARAKGLQENVIRRRHILRNALLPVVTLAGLQAGQLVGGAVLTETVFAWPGIGRLMFESLTARDYNTLLGVFLISAAMVILFNVVTDLVYRLIDPRIGAGGAA